MIKKVILINSANFNFLDIDLHKDLFFLGGNGVGKTSAIRAIHYLFSGDVRNLGIPTDKDGFKEYYFKYSDSYIIYVFEDFFIFMYKSGGEIVKIFSKQEFSLKRILDEENKLYELEKIKKYTRSVNLKKTVKSVGEYREIIYGNNKKYIDFKLTDIKNSETFIGLFNEIFNIDKSIIDAKSIKKAIQTTLEYDKKVINFNHEEYLQKIYQFQNDYKFFKEFEKQKNNIDEASKIKDELLDLELDILRTQQSIKYRVEHERVQESSLKSEIDQRERVFKEAHENLKKTEDALKEESEHFNKNRLRLEHEIEIIEKLKETYSQENLLKNRDLASTLKNLESEEIQTRENYIKLKKGFEDQLEVIQREIRALEYKKESELQREFSNKLSNKKSALENESEEEKEKLRLENSRFEQSQEFELKKLDDEIKELHEEITAIDKKNNTLHETFRVDNISLQKKFKQDQDKLYENRDEKRELKRSKNREVDSLKYDLELKDRALKEALLNNKNSYEKEVLSFNNAIEKFKIMIYSNPSSFKEFLNENVDNWESELYPILDDTLLEKSVEELHPKLISQESLISINVDTSSLKSILTQGEAEIQIKALEIKKETLAQSYRESVERIEQEFINIKDEIQKNINILFNEISELDKELENLENNVEKLSESFEESIKILKINLENTLVSIQKHRDASSQEIVYTKESIMDVHKQTKEKKETLFALLHDIDDLFTVKLESFKAELQLRIERQKEDIDAEIKEKEERKENISADEKIRELALVLGRLKIEIDAAKEANRYLENYSLEKEKITSLIQKQSQLESLIIQNRETQSDLEEKQDRYENDKEHAKNRRHELNKHLRKIQKGLDIFQESDISLENVKAFICDEYLETLLETYSKQNLHYQSSKINLKTKLDRLNSLKNTQHEIDIHFNLAEFDETLFISETKNASSKLEEIIEFKNKKLEVVKQSGHKQFVNFVNNMLPQKMSVFNDSEDKFFSQVAKINKNLRGIDFGVIKDIKIETKTGNKKSIAKLLNELNTNISNLSSLLNESSLFYEKKDVLHELNMLENKFKEIKSELKGDAISLQDTIDLSLSFNENGKLISQVSQLKNESSTGGSMLLKIALAISILELFLQEKKTPFFLIVDEVSRLHSDNQERLRKFSNSKGFGIIFVTPEPTYSKPEAIKYYRFRKNIEDEFEAVELNL